MAKSFVERPKIPTMSDIAKDLEETSGDDVVFQNFDSTWITNGNENVSIEDSDGDDDDINKVNLEKLSADIKEAYLKAVNMVKLCEILREAPSILEHEYSELEYQGREVTAAIDDLKRSSQSLPSASKPQGRKKKGKK